MSSKAIQIAKDIDLARCNGNWSALPELGRRYKKYNPEGASKFTEMETSQSFISLKTHQINSIGTDDTCRKQSSSSINCCSRQQCHLR
jgi:hypothetical protein